MYKLRWAFFFALLAAPTAIGQIAFTGDVQADFPAAAIHPDLIDDVGIPANFPAGVISGWDMQGVALSYDAASDTLYLGIDSRGIEGDADGDGDPASTSAALANNGGADLADLGGSESVLVALDLNNDGTADVIAGIPFGGDISAFTVSTFVGSLFAPYVAFGAPLAANTGAIHANPSAAAPDFEFTITNFSQLMVQFGNVNQPSIGLLAFTGSLDDDGIGEDFIPAVGTLTPIPNPACVRLGNRCWEDTNCDGVQDAGEPNLAGVTVSLFDPSDLNNALATAVTDAMGHYEFCVRPGSYRVGFGVTSGYYWADALVGGDPSADSDAEIGSGLSAVITLAAGVDNDTIDAGYCVCSGPAATVSNLGGGCGLALDPILSALNLPFLGTNFQAQVTSSFPGAFVFPFISVGPVAGTPIGSTGCTTYLDVLNPTNVFAFPIVQMDGAGVWNSDFLIPNDPALLGMQYVLQIRICAPNGPPGPLAPLPDWATNALLVTIGCP